MVSQGDFNIPALYAGIKFYTKPAIFSEKSQFIFGGCKINRLFSIAEYQVRHKNKTKMISVFFIVLL